MTNMKGNVAVITGASGYLGKQLCRDLAGKGVNLVLVDKDRRSQDDFKSELEAEFEVVCLGISANLLDKDCFAGLSETVYGTFDRVDYIVNNAAFYDDCPGWGVKFEDEGYDAWMKVLQVNLMAPFFITQSLLEGLQKSDAPSIVNVSSMYGVVAPDPSLYADTEMTNPAAYAASKGGLIQLSKWMSTMLPVKARVNSISPGGIERGQDETFRNRYDSKTPLGRMTTETEVANAIVFLLSGGASYITGHNLIVDGGWSAW